LAPPLTLIPTRISCANPISTRNKLPNWSQETVTSPIEPGIAERSLFFQVNPPPVLYLPTTDQVSMANKLLEFSGLTAIASSTLFAVDLVILILGPAASFPAPLAPKAHKPMPSARRAPNVCAKHLPP